MVGAAGSYGARKPQRSAGQRPSTERVIAGLAIDASIAAIGFPKGRRCQGRRPLPDCPEGHAARWERASGLGRGDRACALLPPRDRHHLASF